MNETIEIKRSERGTTVLWELTLQLEPRSRWSAKLESVLRAEFETFIAKVAADPRLKPH